MGNKLKICNLMRDFASNKIILSQTDDLRMLKIKEWLKRNKKKCYLFTHRGDNEFAGKIDSQYSFISETSSDILSCQLSIEISTFC